MTHEYNKVDLARQIDFLENRVDLDSFNQDLLWQELTRYFPSIPVGLNVIKKGEALFRGRPTKAGPSFKKVTDFSFVPFDVKKKCKVFGRCNHPTQSLFYSARNLDVAQMECLTHHIDFRIGSLSFGKWIAQEDIILADIVLHEIEEIKTTSVARKREHVHNLIKANISQGQFECVKMILDFFGKQFAKSKIPTHRHYLYSVYLTNRLFELESDGKKIDGVQYPSIPMMYQGDNVVLQPEVIINGKLKLVETYEVMSAISQMKLYSDRTNTSKEINNDEIIWHANETIHGEGYFDELENPKTPIEKGGQGFLTIEIKFDKGKILSILNGMGIELPSYKLLQYTLTTNCESFVEGYCNVTYSNGTFTRCMINEKENNVRCISPWGFLMNFKGEIMFSIGGAVHTFKSIPTMEIGFLPAAYESEIYKKYA